MTMARHSGQISEVQTKDRQNGLKILIAIFILLALSTDFIYGIWLNDLLLAEKDGLLYCYKDGNPDLDENVEDFEIIIYKLPRN